jgi:DNA-binding MarR family transcriptional regulator
MKDTDNEIAANLRVVISRLVKILRNEIKNDELLSLTERSTLALVYQSSGMLPSELAVMEKVSNQSMSQIVNKLLGLGHIKKTSSTADKRKMIITISAAGKKFIEKKRHEKQEWLARSIFEKTTQKEKEVLVKAITVLTKLVNLK